MSIGFGLLSAQTRPGEDDWSRAYKETMSLAEISERLGFSSIWTTEHHFVDDGYMPSLAVVSAAIAAATSKIEIGTGVILAPLHHPLRLAEDAATVSLISDGRFTLGLGLGWSEIEFEGFGADLRLRGASMDEILEILRLAWDGEPFRHSGEIYDLPEIGVRPRPSARIPILIGGGAEPAIRRAARLADGIFANASPKRFLEQLSWLRDECEKVGRDPSELRIMHYSVMLPGSSREAAIDRYTDHIWPMMWKYDDMEESASRRLPPPKPPEFDKSKRDRLFGRSVMAGPSEEIVENLQAIQEQASFDVEFVARSYFHTLSFEDQVELMEQLATEVSPHV